MGDFAAECGRAHWHRHEAQNAVSKSIMWDVAHRKLSHGYLSRHFDKLEIEYVQHSIGCLDLSSTTCDLSSCSGSFFCFLLHCPMRLIQTSSLNLLLHA